jgi:hypothetical protein
MDRYIGTKAVLAKPMTRADYNTYRGWTLPADENGADEGFLVEYLDGGKANVAGHAGYVSWSPTDVFENAYKPAVGQTFGTALEALKARMRVARVGWGSNDWFLEMFHPAGGTIESDYGDCNLPESAWIAIKTSENTFMPWAPSQADMLTNDWVTL